MFYVGSFPAQPSSVGSSTWGLLLTAAVVLTCFNSVVQFLADAVRDTEVSRRHRVGLLAGAMSSVWSLVCLCGIYADGVLSLVSVATADARVEPGTAPSAVFDGMTAVIAAVTTAFSSAPAIVRHEYVVPPEASYVPLLGFILLMVLRVAIYVYAKRRRLEWVSAWGSVNWTHATAVWLTAWLIAIGWSAPVPVVFGAIGLGLVAMPFITLGVVADIAMLMGGFAREAWSIAAAGIRWTIRLAVSAVHTYRLWAKTARGWYRNGPGRVLQSLAIASSSRAHARHMCSERTLVSLDDVLLHEDE